MSFVQITEPPSSERAGLVRNRRDHYLPQGYLKGFIDPQRKGLPQPLWYFEKSNAVWSQRSPKEVGYRHGFYDYTLAELVSRLLIWLSRNSRIDFRKFEKS